jgi:hypothetical protein
MYVKKYVKSSKKKDNTSNTIVLCALNGNVHDCSMSSSRHHVKNTGLFVSPVISRYSGIVTYSVKCEGPGGSMS